MFFKRFFTPATLTDDKILKAIQKDNERVLITLYERNYRPLSEFFKKFKANSHQLAETLNKTVVFFHKKMQHVDNSHLPEIDKIIQDTARSYWIRKKGLEEEIPEIVNSEFDLNMPLENPEDIHLNKKLNILSSHLRIFSDTNKKILFYTYYENYDDNKIADLLDLKSIEEVQHLRKKALKKYRGILVNNYIKRDLI